VTATWLFDCQQAATCSWSSKNASATSGSWSAIRDTKFTAAFDAVFAAEGIADP
jgi:hypothetical protein